MSSKRLPIALDHLRLLAVLLGFAAPHGAAADETAFDREVRKLAGYCLSAPSTSCTARFFALADANGDGVADLAELEALNAKLRVWSVANEAELHPEDLRALRVGFLFIDAVGVERAMLLYDDDGDGALSLAEATADLALDERPLPRLVQDRDFVDWPAVRRRFGATAMLFDYFAIR